MPKQKNNSGKNGFKLIGLVTFLSLLMLLLFWLGYRFFQVVNTQKAVTQKMGADSPKNQYTESPLTGTFYIGSKPYVLFSRFPTDTLDYEEYFLRNTYPDNVDVLLYRGDYNACNIPDVVQSPNHTKFLISYYCGDYPIKFVIGVKDVDDLTPIQKTDVSIGETYTSLMRVISWIDENTLLIERDKWSLTSDFREKTHWQVSYPGFKFIKQIMID